MKKTRIFVIVIVFLTMLLSACTKATPTSTIVVPATAQPAAQPDTAEPNAPELYPVDDTRTVLEKIIMGQHTLNFILNEKRTAEEWDKVLDRMIGNGCSIKPEQKQVIIDWLVEQQK